MRRIVRHRWLNLTPSASWHLGTPKHSVSGLPSTHAAAAALDHAESPQFPPNGDRELSDAELDGVSGGWNFGITQGDIRKDTMKIANKNADLVRTLL